MRIISLLLLYKATWAYLPTSSPNSSRSHVYARRVPAPRLPFVPASKTSTSLDVWWFGGTEQNEVNSNDEECELVAVRIERTSANSRRIAGEIAVPARLDDVWSILTDYDRLAIHVPNLMESRITQKNGPGRPGDGNFRCRLFQKGSQKIIGFDFSASVTMDMTEKLFPNGDRAIGFKCVDSQFFNEFDGQWTVKEQVGADGSPETVCFYTVDVRPKGPVPVAALEWRIREDVPSNLRAVKAATLKINSPNLLPLSKTSPLPSIQASSAKRKTRPSQANQGSSEPILLDWDRDETMAKYL